MFRAMPMTLSGRRYSALLFALALALASSAAFAQELGDPSAVRRLEASAQFLPGLSLGQALAAGQAYSGKLVRVVGRICGIVTRAGQQGELQTTVILALDSGETAMVDLPGRAAVAVGQELRLVVKVPEAGAGRSRPAALAWADEAFFAEQSARSDNPKAHTTAEPATEPPLRQGTAGAPLSGARPVASGTTQPARPRADRRRVFTRTAALIQPVAPAQALTQSFTPVYVPSEQELAQFQSYLRLVKYFNPKLTDFEANLIVQCLFRYCAAFGVPRPLAAAMIYVESRFDPLAKSPAGAMGLTQLMPKTAEALGVASPYNIEQNMRGGIHYLALQLAKYARYPLNERFQLALAAYNAGPEAVNNHRGVPPYSETRNYIAQIAGLFNELYRLGYR